MAQEHVDIKTPEFVSLQFQTAGLGSRAAAFIIDQLLVMLANVLFVVVLFFAGRGFETFFITDMSAVFIALIILILFVINWGYFFAMEYFFAGKTLGKKWIGIRVIQENGHSLTLLSAFIRNLLRIIDALPSAYFLGMIMVFLHSKHKRLGDLVAGTIVVHERRTTTVKKSTEIEKEIELRGLSKNDVSLDDWTLRSIGQREWNLLKTYSRRFLQLPSMERREVTKQLASILFPKLGIELENKNIQEIENTLLILYLIAKDEWEYEL